MSKNKLYQNTQKIFYYTNIIQYFIKPSYCNLIYKNSCEDFLKVLFKIHTVCLNINDT